MADKLFRTYYNEKVEATTLPSSSKVLIQEGTDEPKKIDASLISNNSIAINNNVVLLDSFRKHIVQTLDQNFTVSIAGIKEGSVVSALFNSSSDPNFINVSNIEDVGGDAWVANTDLFLIFRVLNSKVYLIIQELTNATLNLAALPFGATIVQSPNVSNTFVGDPCILKASTGRYFVSHSYFGASGANDKDSFIYYSDENPNENNWTLAKTFNNFIWGTLFEYSNDLYFLGCTNYPLNAEVVISKSTDNGANWSNLVTVLDVPVDYGGWHTAPINPIFKDGFLVKTFEIRDEVLNRHKFNNAVLVFADLTDLTNPLNWSYSNIVPFNDAAMEAAGIQDINTPDETHGFLEGNIIEKSDGDLISLFRLEQAPNSNNSIYLDVSWNSASPADSTLNTTFNFVDMDGGNVKFQVLWDPVSSKHWTISNTNKYKSFNDVRIEAFLLSSDDNCVTWKTYGKKIGFEVTESWESEVEDLGVQYSHLIIDGNDLLIVTRTATQNANNYHDADLFTISKVNDFRSQTEEIFLTGSLIIDENSSRFENANGLSLIKDQSRYFNSPYMLIAENSEKPSWVNGIQFSGGQQLRTVHNKYLNINNGFSIFIVVENLQTISGCRFVSKSNNDGVGDIGEKDYFFAPNTGLGVQNSRGVYPNLTAGGNYIIASSFDSVNEDIYNYLDGSNRGAPSSVTECTFNSDRLEITTPYVTGNFGEFIIGNRDVLGNLYLNGLVKALHVFPTYKNPSEMVTYMNALNSIYNIY